MINKKGFSLIELLIVVSIIAVLAGVAVPYYNDYIVDSRTSVLQNNMATIKKAINQFRADNQRGPAKINIVKGSEVLVAGFSDPFDELVKGPLQYINGSWVRRPNIKYLSSRPLLIDPNSGLEIPLDKLVFESGSCYVAGANKTDFNILTDSAFIDSIGNGEHHDFDVNPFNGVPWSGTASTSLDYTDISIAW